MSCFEIIIGVSGTAYIQKDERKFEVTPGDILFLYPNRVHRGYAITPTGIEFYWVCFQCDKYEEISQEAAKASLQLLGSSPCRKCSDIIIPSFSSCQNISRVNILFHQMLHMFTANYYTERVCSHLLMTLLYELTRQAIEKYSGSTKSEPADKTLSKILEWLRINSSRNISLEDVAREFKFNKNYLAKLFKSKTGMTVSRYIHEIRISQAKQLLCQCDYSIKEIAYMLGFKDEKHFMKLFQKYEQLTPTEFRNAFYKTKLNK